MTPGILFEEVVSTEAFLIARTSRSYCHSCSSGGCRTAILTQVSWRDDWWGGVGWWCFQRFLGCGFQTFFFYIFTLLKEIIQSDYIIFFRLDLTYKDLQSSSLLFLFCGMR